MFKKLFRRLAGGRAQPKFVFTCRGIKSELVASVNIHLENRFTLLTLLNLPNVNIDFIGWRTWRITSIANTQELSRVHNKLISRGML
ncbi:hypothetical protein [Lelliottia wanjuensis]|uniref:hypothetical protein n=1 Tax=Lelliottia wanjuensis TaxID=3050585 RepID=UPI00254C21EB|nr:hypothetical protein [Lelliottia sp. V86_10]MDK9583183.1 hypothetical protein [Lelliottia sp. V86_10]